MSRTAVHEFATDAVAGIADGATILVGGFGMAGIRVLETFGSSLDEIADRCGLRHATG